MADKKVMQSYVYTDKGDYFVSTIERSSSAIVGPVRYNETIAWEWDKDKAERGKQILMGSDMAGFIDTHNNICHELFYKGAPNGT